MTNIGKRRAALLAGLAALLALIAGIVTPVSAGGVQVKEGDKAPNIELPAVGIETLLPDKKDAKTLNVADFKGKKNVVLWFYPKALTGG